METYQVVSCPTNELSYTNKAILNPSSTMARFEHIAIRYPKEGEREFEAFVFSVATDKAVEKGKIAFNLSGRKWANLLVNSVIEVAPYKFIPQSQCLNAITFTTDFANRSTAPKDVEFDSDEMAKQFSQQFTNQAFTLGQIFGFVFKFGGSKVVFELRVSKLEAVNMASGQDVEMQPVEIGLTTGNTIYMFEPAEASDVSLTGLMTAQVSAPRMFSQNWDFASMGVGGLSEQFNTIFRRAFVSRLVPPKFVSDKGFKHIKGILLYGPPGTGKTLIARQIGKLLLAREPKVVNGPEVLNKYVGESEANIRKLFAEAEDEQAKKGLNSGLHVIIFDEIDALCKARGSSGSTSGVGDNVVNQLLTKMDGVNALHNVLIIGMTNRIDLIDEALLRPGRFNLKVEIGLPNKHGRLEILKIHTRKLNDTNSLDKSVNLEALAERTKNFTGAELEDLVAAASTLALNQAVKQTEVDQEALKNFNVTSEHFEYALKHDVKPALGASDDDLKKFAGPIIEWDPAIGKIQSKISKLIEQLSRRDVGQDRPYYVLFIGESGSGLTTLAARMAIETKFPFIRFYGTELTAGMSDSVKVQHMDKLFKDALRSEFSCVVIDGLDDILDYDHVGPRYSVAARSKFRSAKNFALPDGHRMVVICTCNEEQMLGDLKLNKTFQVTIRVPSLIRPEQVRTALTHLSANVDGPFGPGQINELVDELRQIPFKMGIKWLEYLTEQVSQNDPSSRVKDFIERMHAQDLVIRIEKPFEF